MIIKKLNTFQVSIVALFLVAFGSVFMCDFLCDLGIIEIKLYSHQHQIEIPNDQSSHNHQVNQHSDGDHHHDLMTSGHHHADQQDKEQNDCCDEETNALFSSLIKHRTEAFNLNTNYIQLSAIVLYLENIAVFTALVPIGELYFQDLPPPSSWDIRIFIQSFLN